MSISALRAANTIIEHSLERGQMVDQLKLQKLLYLAQGISLAVRHTVLFADKIEAWQYGPVVRSVYNAAKVHGAAPIAAPLGSPLARIAGGHDLEADSIIFEALRAYGDLTGVELMVLTHDPTAPEGRPWVEARKRVSNLRPSPEISTRSMEDSFRELLQQQPML